MFLVDGSNWMFTLTFYIVLHLRDDVLITFLLRNRLRRWRWRMTMKDQHGNIKMRIQISSLSSDQMAKRTEHIYLYIYRKVLRSRVQSLRAGEIFPRSNGEILHRQEHSNISSIPIYSRACPGAHNDLVGAHLCILAMPNLQDCSKDCSNVQIWCVAWCVAWSWRHWEKWYLRLLRLLFYV